MKSANNELLVLIEEYKSLREEVISLQEFNRQNITTTYAGIGVLGAIATFIIDKNLQFFFLLFPFYFYSLALTSTKYALAGINIGNYVKNILTPRIRLCLSQENKNEDYSHVLSWEESKGVVRRYGVLFLPANGAHYWITLFSALLCLTAYFVFPPNPQPFQEIIIIALIMNVIAFLYTVVVGLFAGYSR